MTVEHKIIDNFLPSNIFDNLQNLLLPSEYSENTERIAWYYTPDVVDGIAEKGEEDWRLVYFTHIIFENTITSSYYNNILPLVENLGTKALIRIKINLFPNTEKLKEHGMHFDMDYPHKAAIFSINTCDGYTKLEDGTKIGSVANRMLLFDASTLHSSTTTTDQPVRININFNYF